jgi:hypothetical protein
VDDLVVNNQLPTTIVDDQCSNAASTVCESCVDFAIEPTLIDDPETLLDVTSLGHADHQAIRTHVENAVLLVDGAEHALDVDTGLRIAHEGALFLKLASEEIDTQVSVLTGLWRGRDADDLARTALKDDEIADADELARNRDGVSWEAAARLDEADLLADTLSHTAWTTFFIFDDHLFTVMVVMLERVRDAVGSTLEATPKGVVFALVVVVTHVFAARLVDFDVFFFDSNFFGGSTTFVLDVVGRIDAAAVVALGDVELGLEGLISDLSAIDVNADFLIVTTAASFDVELVVEGLISDLSAIDVDVDFLIVSTVASFDVDVDLGVFVLPWLSVAKDSNQQVLFGRQITLGVKQNTGCQTTIYIFQTEGKERLDVPFSTELYFWVAITFLVDSDVLFTTGAARGVDVDFFL